MTASNAFVETEQAWREQPEMELIETLRSSYFQNASDASIKLVLAYCRATGLSPMGHVVHIVPMYDKRTKKYRDVIMPGIAHYRIQASRTGLYSGQSAPEYGPMVTENFSVHDDRTGETKVTRVTFPEWCKISVTRVVNGRDAVFTAIEYWMENYATTGFSDLPNSMWRKRARGQLAKVTEAQALRKAFPEMVIGYTAEEMEGRAIEDDLDELGVRKPKPPEKPTAAKAQLDAFAGPAATTQQKGAEDKEPDPAEGEIEDAEVVSDGEADSANDAAAASGTSMPSDLRDAMDAGRWGGAWTWFRDAVRGMKPGEAVDFFATHDALLKVVSAHSPKQAATVTALAEECGVNWNG